MLTLWKEYELRNLLGLNDSVTELNGVSLFDLAKSFREYPSGPMELDFDDLKKLFEMTREDVWAEASNPAFYSC